MVKRFKRDFKRRIWSFKIESFFGFEQINKTANILSKNDAFLFGLYLSFNFNLPRFSNRLKEILYDKFGQIKLCWYLALGKHI